MQKYISLIMSTLLTTLPVSAKADWRDEIIYFVMIDRFAEGTVKTDPSIDPENPLAFHGGDLKGLTENIDEIADLGATALWITPVVQQMTQSVPTEGLDFYGHHGYWAEDFTKLDPRFGTEEDLKALVEEAHDRGIKVLLDVVYNHVGYDASWTTTRPEWLRQGEECGGDLITECLAGLPDLKTELPEVRDFLFDAHLGLAERTGIDGFRLDTYRHIAQDFWVDHRAATRARLGEDFFLLGEIWDADKFTAKIPFGDDTLDGLFDFAFRDRTLKFLTNIENPERYARYYTKRHDVAEGHVLAPFLSSHDMPMLLAMLRGDTQKLRIAFALQMFAEGTPVITWGEEVGRAGKPWPDNREDMPWGEDSDQRPGAGIPRDDALRADVQAMISLRQSNADMRHAPVETIAAQGNLLVLRKGSVILGINRGTDPVALPALPAGNWVRAEGASLTTNLPPVSYVFFELN